jgi:hypothetical protein
MAGQILWVATVIGGQGVVAWRVDDYGILWRVPARHLIGYDSDLGIWGYGDWWSRDFRPIEIHLMVWMDSIRCVITSIEGGGGSKTLYRPVIDPLASSGIERLRHVDLENKNAKNCQKCQKNAKQIFDIKLCANLKY